MTSPAATRRRSRRPPPPEVARIIVRAASPWERASHPAFAPCVPADPALVGARRAAWARALGVGDPAALAARLRDRGHDAPDFERALAEVEIARPERLPRWARDLARLLEPGVDRDPIAPFRNAEVLDAQTLRTAGVDPDQPWACQGAIAPFLRHARRRLRRAARRSGEALTPPVERQLLLALTQRLAMLVGRVFLARVEAEHLLAGFPGAAGMTIYRACFGDDVPVALQWRRLLLHYPVLGRLLAVALRHWGDASAELLQRLAQDRQALTEAFGGGEPLGPLASIRSDTGDSHEQGRAVAILGFAGGQRVVYKPKDLRIAAAALSLLRWCNDAGLSLPLPVRTILLRRDYAWEAFAVERPCGSRAEVERYYRRMGQYARLLQLTDGMDFTTDNVLAQGETPVLVDLEMFVAPRYRSAIAGEEGHGGLGALTSDLPLRSALVTSKVYGEAGRRPADLGALAGSSQRLAPFKLPVPLRRPGEAPAFEWGYLPFSGGSAAPVMDGAPVPVEEFADQVIAGYAEMAALLRDHRQELAAADGPLAPLRSAPIRALCRDTHIYARILGESLWPDRLRDGVLRELCLERLWRGRFADPAINAAEIESIRDLDIPLFRAVPDRNALYTERGHEVPDFFEAAPWARIAAHLEGLGGRTVGAEVEELRSALFTLAPWTRVTTTPVPRPPAAPDFAAAAREIGRELVRSESVGGQAAGWLGLRYQPEFDAWEFTVLHADLLSGTVGIAVLLADLARGARGAPSPTLERLLARLERRLTLRLGGEPDADPWESPGAFHGWGSWYYGLVRAHVALGDRAAVSRAVSLVEGLDVDHLDAVTGDVIDGPAGLLAVLGSTPAWAMTPALARLMRAVALRVGAQLTGGDTPGPAPLRPEGATGLDALPAGRTGVVWSLCRAARQLGDATLAPADALVQQALPPEPGVGPAGQAALLLDLADHAPVARDAAVHHATAVLDRMGAPATGPELLEAGELALALARLTMDDRYLATARRFGAGLVARRAATGRWFPERLASDRHLVSAISGTASVAHLCLRLAEPGRHASIRLLGC